jgi:alkylated DNA repair dioxygenase AlkB
MSNLGRPPRPLPYGLIYKPEFISSRERQEILAYLRTLHPLWENRFSVHNPPPAGQTQRQLLRPVYWLGNWQFACLDYYHPPKGIQHRCVQAEPFPPVLRRLVDQIENLARHTFNPKDVPSDWHFNTCLINYYGNRLEADRSVDVARVGEHKDFEPGPVGSLSLGEKALFQFVESRSKNHQSRVVLQQWLEDGSLQLFGGDRFKKQLFHRVQRVERKAPPFTGLQTEHFETRRINFTFRYVPTEHILPYRAFPEPLKEDIFPYMKELARHSTFFAAALSDN